MPDSVQASDSFACNGAGRIGDSETHVYITQYQFR